MTYIDIIFAVEDIYFTLILLDSLTNYVAFPMVPC